jgi:hypothetical protein
MNVQSACALNTQYIPSFIKIGSGTQKLTGGDRLMVDVSILRFRLHMLRFAGFSTKTLSSTLKRKEHGSGLITCIWSSVHESNFFEQKVLKKYGPQRKCFDKKVLRNMALKTVNLILSLKVRTIKTTYGRTERKKHEFPFVATKQCAVCH